MAVRNQAWAGAPDLSQASSELTAILLLTSVSAERLIHQSRLSFTNVTMLEPTKYHIQKRAAAMLPIAALLRYN